MRSNTEISIQAVANGFLVALPMQIGYISPIPDYKDAMVAAAKVMKGQDDVMDKIREEQQEAPKVNTKMGKEECVFIFKTLDEALSFVKYKFTE